MAGQNKARNGIHEQVNSATRERLIEAERERLRAELYRQLRAGGVAAITERFETKLILFRKSLPSPGRRLSRTDWMEFMEGLSRRDRSLLRKFWPEMAERLERVACASMERKSRIRKQA